MIGSVSLLAQIGSFSVLIQIGSFSLLIHRVDSNLNHLDVFEVVESQQSAGPWAMDPEVQAARSRFILILFYLFIVFLLLFLFFFQNG